MFGTQVSASLAWLALQQACKPVSKIIQSLPFQLVHQMVWAVPICAQGPLFVLFLASLLIILSSSLDGLQQWQVSGLIRRKSKESGGGGKKSAWVDGAEAGEENLGLWGRAVEIREPGFLVFALYLHSGVLFCFLFYFLMHFSYLAWLGLVFAPFYISCCYFFSFLPNPIPASITRLRGNKGPCLWNGISSE